MDNLGGTVSHGLMPFLHHETNSPPGNSRHNASECEELKAAFNLTPREIEVLQWLSEGKRDVEIATILGISPRTVNHHVSSILGKLGAENRSTAVHVAYLSRK